MPKPEIPPLWKSDPVEPAAEPPDTEEPSDQDDPQPDVDQPTDQVPEPESDPEGDPAPGLTPEALQRAAADIQRRDLACSRREQELSKMAKAQRLLGQGKHSEAAQLLGVDPNRLLAETWGESFVPEPEPAAEPEQRFSSVEEKMAGMEARIEASEHRRDIAEAMADNIAALPMARSLAKKRGQFFYAAVKKQADDEEERSGIRPPYPQLLERVNTYFSDDACESLGDMVKDVPELRERFLTVLKAQPAKPTPGPKGKPAKPPATPDPSEEPGDDEPTLSGDLDGEPPVEFEKPKTRDQRRNAALAHLKGGLWRKEA